MSATNTDSPVLDGVWYRPYLLTPNTTNSGANSLPPSAKVGQVGTVTNNSSDWITLPSLADVPNGHEMLILCLAGGAFKLRTPTSSNEKVNNVDCDGTNTYACTDGDILRVVKVSNTAGWVAQSITALGALRGAVVPS